MNEIELLKDFMENTTARLSYLDRWLIHDDGFWFVYEHKHYQKIKKVEETESFEHALNILRNQK